MFLFVFCSIVFVNGIILLFCPIGRKWRWKCQANTSSGLCCLFVCMYVCVCVGGGDISRLCEQPGCWASNVVVIHVWIIRKGLKGSEHRPLEVVTRNFLGRIEENQEERKLR
jgi:hypothetical protein